MVPNGDGPRDHPLLKSSTCRRSGTRRAGPLVTKTLLFAPDGDQMNTRTPPAGRRKFRALDKATGKTVWETDLDAGVTGAPMTYMHMGKQYIVVAIGGRIILPNSSR